MTDETQIPDATWLFEGHDAGTSDRDVVSWKGQHSEHWWTAVFSLLLLHLSNQPVPPEIPLRRHRRKEPRWEYHCEGSLDYHPLTFASLLVEARLDKTVATQMFGITDWPEKFWGIEVDLVMLSRDQNRVILIENKTVRGGVNRLDLYVEAAKYLRSEGINASLHVLISAGHWNNAIWDEIEKNDLTIILWEDVLRLLHSTTFFQEIFHEDLPRYFANYP